VIGVVGPGFTGLSYDKTQIAEPFFSPQNTYAIGLFPATSTAVAHNSSGIAAFPCRFRLHSSRRALAPSRLTVGVSLPGMTFLLAGNSYGRTTNSYPGVISSSLSIF
jgi:hypothetical protein